MSLSPKKAAKNYHFGMKVCFSTITTGCESSSGNMTIRNHPLSVQLNWITSWNCPDGTWILRICEYNICMQKFDVQMYGCWVPKTVHTGLQVILLLHCLQVLLFHPVTNSEHLTNAIRDLYSKMYRAIALG